MLESERELSACFTRILFVQGSSLHRVTEYTEFKKYIVIKIQT
jgi:hypothetical protein